MHHLYNYKMGASCIVGGDTEIINSFRFCVACAHYICSCSSSGVTFIYYYYYYYLITYSLNLLSSRHDHYTILILPPVPVPISTINQKWTATAIVFFLAGTSIVPTVMATNAIRARASTHHDKKGVGRWEFSKRLLQPVDEDMMSISLTLHSTPQQT